MTAPIVVSIADCAVTSDPDTILVTYALGSCIAVAMYDPVAKVAGLLHFMLPDSTPEFSKNRHNPYTFADTGIPLLFDRVIERGAAKQRIVVRIAGGAQMLEDGYFKIGKLNQLSSRKVLWKIGLLPELEAVGGNVSRTVSLETATGKFSVRETPMAGIGLTLEAGRTRRRA